MKKTLLLLRFEHNATETIGALFHDGHIVCVTLEPAWLENRVDISCIPEGFYWVHRYESDKHGECWRIENVCHRDKIRIHRGNTHAETTGCICPGIYVGYMMGKRAVHKSGLAMQVINDLIGEDNSFVLRVKSVEVEKLAPSANGGWD